MNAISGVPYQTMAATATQKLAAGSESQAT
jgi:hypothetical protein